MDDMRIAQQLRQLGVREGGCLLVHASLRSLGFVSGGPETVVRGLLDALGDTGTLLMPSLSYATVNAAHPVFDVEQTPSCVGALPEYFRTRTGTVRSIHPTHSVSAFGAQAEPLVHDHHRDSTPCGEHSPFRRLREMRGQILFLGCGLRPNTSMHAVEEVAEVPYLFGDFVDYRILLGAGQETTMRVKRHAFSGWNQRYDRLASLLNSNDLREGSLLEATVHLVECAPMWEAALEAMRRNPFHFVEKT